MKASNEFKIGKFKSNLGNTYEIKEVIKGTGLNRFLGEEALYGVVWYDGKIAVFSAKGISSIIRNS